MGPRRHHTWSGLQEAPELLRTRRVPELAQRLGLDLPDPLAGDREVLPDFFQRVLATVGEAEPEPQHLLLARREGVEDLVRLLPEREADDRLDGRDDLLVLDEVAQVAVLLLADRRLQRDGLLRDLQHLAHLVHGDVHLRRDLLRVGSRPSSWTSWREVRMSLLIVSIMCTGMRLVRAWSAMARVMAWRIHQVA